MKDGRVETGERVVRTRGDHERKSVELRLGDREADVCVTVAFVVRARECFLEAVGQDYDLIVVQ